MEAPHASSAGRVPVLPSGIRIDANPLPMLRCPSMKQPPPRIARRHRTRTGVATLALLFSGAAHADFITVDGRDFTALVGNAPYAETANQSNLSCSGGPAQNLFSAQLHLPPGDLILRGLAAWGSDLGTENLTLNLSRVCQEPLVGSAPQRTLLSSIASSGTPGNFFVQSPTLNVRVSDQDRCVYLLEAQFGLNACSALLSMAKARVRFDPLADPIFSNGFENLGP